MRTDQVRAAFFENLVGVASFVGREPLQHFILPCILQVCGPKLLELLLYGAVSSSTSSDAGEDEELERKASYTSGDYKASYSGASGLGH